MRRLKHAAGVFACAIGIVLSRSGNHLLWRYGHHLTVDRRFAEHRDAAGRPRIWIDVGAHRGETTLAEAQSDPLLTVYAFEPNLELASQLFGKLPNYIVIGQAVSNEPGYRRFNLNSDDSASSLLALDTEAQSWHGVEPLRTERVALVPTVRLDSFFETMGLTRVQRLKIDAQGHDLEVLRSADTCISSIDEIVVEVRLAATAQYHDASNTREAVTTYLGEHGFHLVRSRTQTYGQEANLTFRRQDV